MALKDKLDIDYIDDEYDEEEDTLEGKFLIFTQGSEAYGIEIRHVTEIICIQNISEVPDMPAYIKGVINLRGKVIPVMDMCLRFGMPEHPYDDRTCVVVVNVNEKAVGLIVDRVSEVLTIPASEIEPAPEVRKGETSRFIQGMGKVGEEVKILLNVEKLLFDGGNAN